MPRSCIVIGASCTLSRRGDASSSCSRPSAATTRLTLLPQRALFLQYETSLRVNGVTTPEELLWIDHGAHVRVQRSRAISP